LVERVDRKVLSCKRFFEVTYRKFYKASASIDNYNVSNLIQDTSPTGYVSLAVCPSGEKTLVGKSLNPSLTEMNRMIHDWLRRDTEEFNDSGLTVKEHDEIVFNDFISKLERGPDGRYIVLLPWNERWRNLSDNRKKAFSRLSMLEGQFRRNEKQMISYTKAIEELKAMGFLDKVPMSYLDSNNCVLIPHHAVVKEYRETTKWRVVFAANEKERGGYSLNESLESGLNLLKVLHIVLLRIRKGKYMFTQDLQKCFFQLQLSEKNPVRLLILWTMWNEAKELFERELLLFTRMPWGTNASMFCILAVILHHVWGIIENIKETNPKEAFRLQRMLETMYVDDIIEVEDTEESCLEGAEGNISVFKKAAMVVTRTRSNSPLLREKYAEHARDPEGNLVLKQGVLGMNWNMQDDTLSVNFDRLNEKIWKNPFTRRVALAMIASFFDPIDLLSPFYFQFKLMYHDLESLCKNDWDFEISETIFKMWMHKFEQYVALKDITVP
jgi:hypothetical protein